MNENFKGAIEYLLSKKFGGNRSQMAVAMGFTPQQVAQWISGKSKPSPDSCVKIAQFLGRTFEQIRDGDEYIKKSPSIEARLQALEEKVARLLESGPQATAGTGIEDEDVARVVQLMQSGSPDFRRIVRKTVESLRGSF